jgi:hypothetical protein
VLIRSASNRKHKRWQAGLVGIGDDGLALAAAASIRDVQMYSRADMKSAGVHVLKVETQIHCEDRWKRGRKLTSSPGSCAVWCRRLQDGATTAADDDTLALSLVARAAEPGCSRCLRPVTNARRR